MLRDAIAVITGFGMLSCHLQRYDGTVESYSEEVDDANAEIAEAQQVSMFGGDELQAVGEQLNDADEAADEFAEQAGHLAESKTD
jgi:hypothetical protein